MKLQVKTLIFAGLFGATLLATPAIADAQGRRAVRVARPSRVVVVGGYYRPFFYDPWYFSPYSQGTRRDYGYYPRVYDVSASLRLQVAPRETEVFIDGYDAGTVDEFDGVFQRLRIEPGEHTLELYLPGHRRVERKIYLQPGREFRVRLTMEPIGAGEAEPARPVARQLPAAGATQLPSAGATEPPFAGSTPRRVPGRPRPRASNIESSFGELALRVQPGDAMVTIDGEQWEGAPDDQRLVVQLGAGPHRVEVRKDGYRTTTQGM